MSAAPIGTIRLVLALIGLTLWTLILAPFQWLFLKVWPRGAAVLPHLYHRGTTSMIGARVHVHGRIASERPLLLVANHVSWLDIPVLSAVAPVSFIAKREMITWPIFGWLARGQRTVFVDRADRRGAGRQAAEIADRLRHGDVMVLFPEGTTSDGNRVLDFNPSLLGAASGVAREAGRAFVQPVALSYARLHGMRADRTAQRRIGWPGIVGLTPHLPDTIREGALDVHVSFGEAVAMDATTRRRPLAEALQRTIRAMRVERMRDLD